MLAVWLRKKKVYTPYNKILQLEKEEVPNDLIAAVVAQEIEGEENKDHEKETSKGEQNAEQKSEPGKAEAKDVKKAAQ